MPVVLSPLRIASQRMVDSNQLTGPGVKAKPVSATNSGFADFDASDRSVPILSSSTFQFDAENSDYNSWVGAAAGQYEMPTDLYFSD